jgi:hypothetical protein
VHDALGAQLPLAGRLRRSQEHKTAREQANKRADNETAKKQRISAGVRARQERHAQGSRCAQLWLSLLRMWLCVLLSVTQQFRQMHS